ncbi:MAG: GntR family transcriptional regulator [Betaproteobacteria bacterium]|nr:GntR family transcriptional regulator [Betaproteobacteria bacterium]
MNAHAKTKRPAASKFFNPFPKYLQLRELLRKRMQSQYEVGDRLPTEDAFEQGVRGLRETVREALRSFEYDGLIERHRARGTFLLRKPEELQESRLTGLSEDFSALRLDTHTKMLASGVITAPAIAKQLKLDSDSVFRISRLRYFEGKPLAVHVAHLPLFIGERVNSADLRLTSIVQVMEDVLHIECYELSQQVDAIVADPEFAGQLECADRFAHTGAGSTLQDE